MKLVKTSIFSAIITFIRIASGFVAGKFVAIFTGPAGVALIGQFNNFITIILTFANGAINTGVVKYTAEYEDDVPALKRLFSTSLKITISFSIVIGIVLLLFAPYFGHWVFNSVVYINPIRVLGMTIIFYALNTLLVSIINGKKQINSYTIINTAGSIVGLLFTIILVYYYKLEGALYALVLAQSIVFFVTLVLVIKSDWFSWSYFNQSFDKSLGRNLAKFGLMAIVSSVTGPIAQITLRNLIIGKLGVNSAGYWQGMMRVSDGYLLIVTISLSTYYLPKLSSLHTDEDLRKEIFQGYKIITPIVFLSCLLIFLLKSFIIKGLFTSSFLPMETLFLWQLLGDFFKITAYLLAFLMLAKAMTRIYIITEIVFNASYIALGYICIHFFNIKGITIAFAINYFMYLIVMVFLFKKLLFTRIAKI